jgi:uncharacterized protein (DUF885 family)
LKQLVEQSQEKKGDNQIEDIERIGVKQVEQLRYEMQQKVESQLFNNHNNMNSHIDSLKQRMEVNSLLIIIEIRRTKQKHQSIL